MRARARHFVLADDDRPKTTTVYDLYELYFRFSNYKVKKKDCSHIFHASETKAPLISAISTHDSRTHKLAMNRRAEMQAHCAFVKQLFNCSLWPIDFRVPSGALLSFCSLQ